MKEEPKVVDNVVDFNKETIKKIVEKLVKDGIISSSESVAVTKLYESDERELYKIVDESNNIQRATLTQRFINLVGQALLKRNILTKDELETFNKIYQNDGRKYDEILNEVANISREDLLMKLNIKKEQEEVKQENRISLENVKDFRKDNGKEYISIHSNYPNEQVKVIENRTGKSANELFEAYKNNADLPTVDGFVNSFDVYKDSIEPDKAEVKMYNVTELAKEDEFNKLTDKQKEVVIGTLKSIVNELAGLSEESKQKLNSLEVNELIKMLDKDVYLSPDENIVLLCVPNDATKDQPMTVVSDAKGNYKLVSLNTKGHEFVSAGETPTEESENKEIEENAEEFGKDQNGISLVKKPKPKDSIVEEAA